MSITTLDDIAAGLAADQADIYLKVMTAAKAAGSFQSAWMANGNPPAGVAPPAYTAGSGYTCDKSTTGALNYVNGAVQNWLAKWAAFCTGVGTIIIADRLWSCSGMGYAASTYTVTTPGALPARITDNGLNCELIVEQFAAAGAASGTLTCNYLDSGGGSRAGVIPAVVSAPVTGQVQFVPLLNNLGVKSLVSVVNSATWTSGTWGMTIIKRIAEIPINVAAAGTPLDWAGLGIPKLPADCCLFFIYCADGTTARTIFGRVNVIDK
jgi:hypothetical protein